METIVFYDGVCKLCNGFVQFLIRGKNLTHIRFISLQEAKANDLIPEQLLDTDSILIYQKGKFKAKSAGVFALVNAIGYPYKLLTLFSWMPLKIRDSIYDFIARNRYKTFGKYDQCILPNPQQKSLFLSAENVKKIMQANVDVL